MRETLEATTAASAVSEKEQSVVNDVEHSSSTIISEEG